MTGNDPVYLRVVEELRAQIVDGTLPPGAPIPSRAQLTQRFRVGETAARHALRVLAAEGLIIGRVGSGHYVREKSVLYPLQRSRHIDHDAPFAADMQLGGHRATWDWRSEPVKADREIARRLRLQPAAPVVRTRYVFRAEGRPMQLATSYEPAELGKGQAVAEEGSNGRKGLLARMSAAGVKITDIRESVHTRVPQPTESDLLDLPTGVHVLHVERTHWSGDRPVETSDVVVPGDRFRLVYSVPLGA
ncbi:GntR family transcriptional regulator [Sphaerisporangium krabiense]|uniref:GntR family transcriptional regulator n=1 Tax=Sphaerisporangium krabiense TaxID=763782 RepID=A0A7W8Z6Z0_9ACTN|nr:GntR family transcriptional regulator [Sphaerisporangium krabiense]MBB5628647.1 GntR family transcriptional regulator [Sphaerisporangium krabiense]GII60514.1 GntR family transcriptional regulator [Sphaerisporangium krabiense]